MANATAISNLTSTLFNHMFESDSRLDNIETSYAKQADMVDAITTSEEAMMEVINDLSGQISGSVTSTVVESIVTSVMSSYIQEHDDANYDPVMNNINSLNDILGD
jgi:hypothetical protein